MKLIDKRILVAEYDELLLSLITRILMYKGCEASAAVSGDSRAVDKISTPVSELVWGSARPASAMTECTNVHIAVATAL